MNSEFSKIADLTCVITRAQESSHYYSKTRMSSIEVNAAVYLVL